MWVGLLSKLALDYMQIEHGSIRVEGLPWTHDLAVVYADLRTSREAAGLMRAPLASMDMMIVAHAKALFVRVGSVPDCDIADIDRSR